MKAAIVKFGEGRCSACYERFTKHRHGQRFCSAECREAARTSRRGLVSHDPRFVEKRRRRAVLERVSPSGYPHTGKRGKRAKSINENNNLQRAFSESSIAQNDAPQYVRIWEGRTPPSEIELRLRHLVPTGIRLKGGHPLAAPSVLYRYVGPQKSGGVCLTDGSILLTSGIPLPDATRVEIERALAEREPPSQ